MGASVTKLDTGNIDLKECIGEGGFGSVRRVKFKKPYKGYTEAAGKTVVHEFASKEVEVMSKLYHPNIVKLLGICENLGAKLIVMEYAPNGSLHDYLKDPTKPLPYELQKKWAKESALAIKYLHGHDFLHRDIKPQNCLLFQDNLLKLCDFGLAREIEKSQTTSSRKGTYRYMAPEIHVGNKHGRAIYSKPADIWAYGMLLLAICTRKPPFQRLEWHRVVFEVGNGAKPSIPEGCPKDLSDIMQQCRNVDPKLRPTITSIAMALGACRKREYHPEHQGKQLGCCHTACCPNGDMVMASWEKLYLIDGDGKCKMPLISTETDADRNINCVYNISVSPLGYIFVVSYSCRYVHVFTVEGKYLHCFTPDGDSNTSFKTKCLAIDREGRLLVGDREMNTITIHTCQDGKMVNKINCSKIGKNASMIVNSKNQILIHSNPVYNTARYSTVVAIDYSDNEVFSFTPKIDEDVSGRHVRPCGIVCDDNDNIYVAMLIDVQGVVVFDTGHIHKYSPTGEFLQCIARGLFHPCDLSMTPDGSLLVANEKSILKYTL
ncbi:mitogen-activated protein kinase kinase kinase 7-like [Amphiura filiformis]|uniref:mitogen-activated protein kinase kinase kinase 7-like n=1 Tax=Amphiura filiformis TaxID=82378 RepID=UPI003B220C12